MDIIGSNISSYLYQPPPINSLSTSTKSIMLGTSPQQKQSGALGVRLLYSQYTGPVMQIKVGTYSGSTFTGSTVTDFYAPANGSTGVNALTDINGATLASYITTQGVGSICYVTKWYDQTGNSNHGVYISTSDQLPPTTSYWGNNIYVPSFPPTFNTTTNAIDFTNGGYFKLPDNSFPTANTPYSYIFKPNVISTPAGCIFRGGEWGTGDGKGLNGFLSATYIYLDAWTQDTYSTTSTFTNGLLIADCYDSTSGRSIYFNEVKQPGSGDSTSRTQTSLYNYIGGPFGSGDTSVPSYANYPNFNGSLSYFYWANANLSVSDIKILGFL